MVKTRHTTKCAGAMPSAALGQSSRKIGLLMRLHEVLVAAVLSRPGAQPDIIIVSHVMHAR